MLLLNDGNLFVVYMAQGGPPSAQPRQTATSLSFLSLLFLLMPTAVISSSGPFNDRALLERLLNKVKARRIAEGAPSGIALVICDALRDRCRRRQTERLRWVLGHLELLQFDKYSNIVLSHVYWPQDGELPRTKSLRHQRVTLDLIYGACVVVLCGGNAHALLQSFRENAAALEALKSSVSDDLCLLLAWSAGTTCCGLSAEHTADRLSQLTLRLNQPPCLRGLGLFPNYSFAPHRERDRS